MRNARSVAARLAGEVAAGRLQFDGSQCAAAVRLDELSRSLGGAPPGLLRRVRSRIFRLAHGDLAPPARRGVYLWGGVGRGKTLLMDFFVGCLAQPPDRSDPHGATRVAPRVERTHFYHFMRDIHAALRAIKQRESPLDVAARQLANRVQVLCLDEFFVSDIADAMILSGLFDGLFSRGVVLVATSNVPPDELYRDGLQRQRFLPAIASIIGHVDVLHLDGGVDYRLRQLAKAPTYLDRHAADTPSALQARFLELAGGSSSGAAILRVEDRELNAVDTAPGMAWFEFAELCDGPRSQNDYIELAHLYHTLFIANVPLFDVANENAARRFIMLIDEVYDRGVKLVVSAAAPPPALYHGERLTFEFARTASRLMEMQSRDYLAVQHRP